MTANKTPALLDARVRTDKIPAQGRVLKINATLEQLAEIAKISHVSSIDRLSAQLLVAPFKGGFQVTGKLDAEIIQPCVVTLEPVRQRLSEPLNRVFLPGPDLNSEASAGSETFVDLEDDAMPDHFEDVELDMSGYLMEMLGLAIDLYPRLQGAEMEPEQHGDNDAQLSPFAVLKSLEVEKTGKK